MPERHLPSLPEEQPDIESDGLVLVVEDDDMGAKAIRRAFKLSPWKKLEIEVCDSAREAVKKLVVLNPDLILSETMTQDGSGIGLYRWINEYSPGLLNRLGFVGGGAYSDQIEDFMSTMQAKGRLIQKPFKPEEIIQLAQKIFENRFII